MIEEEKLETHDIEEEAEGNRKMRQLCLTYF